VIREDWEVQEVVLAQDRLDDQVKAVAHYRERDALFRAPPVERKNSLVNWNIRHELNESLPIGLNQLDLTGEALLARDLASHPSLFPFSPGRQGEGFQHGVGGIYAGDRSVEITIHLRHSDTLARAPAVLYSGLIVQHGTRVRLLRTVIEALPQ